MMKSSVRIFDKILVANRGEIAVRIMRACREMGIRSVAVFSEADRSALHVLSADEAYCIGPSPPLESYLCAEKLIEIAKKTGAIAIHPGYGFLAENHNFAAQCEENGLVFIGPDARAMKLVGDKVASRKTISRTGIPIIPGMETSGGSFETYRLAAEKIGYPVMIKASAGGGGKGMRIVRDEKSLKTSLEAGKREAKTAFGDASVYLEKCIQRPRHVEFQVLADKNGNVVHLFERECSIQRRHQKIVEETPSTAIDQTLRERMGASAVEVVRATGYSNAGTVEFLLDEDGKYYFLEVNARIQVEHPVTEMVTGVDLVKWQIRIAAGESLDFAQEDLQQRGHAIECRLYAENPANGFLPSLGRIHLFKSPSGPGIRLDSGIYSGYEVTRFYDPILAKLITWGEDRESARKRMVHALHDTVILGIASTIPYSIQIMEHDAFKQGMTMTDFIEKNLSTWTGEPREETLRIALMAAALQAEASGPGLSSSEGSSRSAYSPWTTAGRWRIGEP